MIYIHYGKRCYCWRLTIFTENAYNGEKRQNVEVLLCFRVIIVPFQNLTQMFFLQQKYLK